MIKSSDFYNQLNKYDLARKQAIANLQFKGVVITESAILSEVANGILAIEQVVQVVGNSVIVVAELANVTITIKDSNDTIVATNSTGANGAVLYLPVTEINETYTVVATDNLDNELWTNTIEVGNVGVYNCKTGKPLADYTWAEIKEAGVKNLAKYMWSVYDEKKMASFLGSTSATYTTLMIAGFNQKEKADGSWFGIQFLMKNYTSSSYSYYSSNLNGVSWEGSLIRQNCLKEGSEFYLWNNSVTSSSSGTYYTWDNDNKVWLEKTLPTDFVANTKYYTKEIKLSHGAFWNGLSDDIKPYISEVVNNIWGGWGGAVTSSATATADNTIIKSKDYLYIPTDSNIFGNKNRRVTYSKYNEEGEQYEAFKEFRENNVRRASDIWLASPYLPNATYACFWNNNGCVIISIASSSYYVALGLTL